MRRTRGILGGAPARQRDVPGTDRHVDPAYEPGFEVQQGDDPVELRERIVAWTTKNVLEMRANWDAQEA